MTYIGIDPGFSGAIAFIYGFHVAGDPPAGFRDMPVVGEGPLKRLDVSLIIQGIKRSCSSPIVAAIERAQPMPKQGVSSTFRYGVVYGQLLAIMDALGAVIHLPTPARWKKDMGLTRSGKDGSRELAMRLFPGLNLERKKDHNFAEAALLAEWARRLA